MSPPEPPDDAADVTWKDPSWGLDTIWLVALLPDAALWYDSTTDTWHRV